MLERITRREGADLFLAWMAISVSFAIIKIAPYGILGTLALVTPIQGIIYFGIALVTVGIGFIFHEMAHKFTAIHYGYWAEFRKDDVMLLIAVVMAALVGFVFAAPGATVIYTSAHDERGISRKENGIISASGPLVNILLCIPFAAMILFAGGLAALKSGNLLAVIGIAGIQINAMIATFNLLPISILDGNKVIAWSVPVFIVLIVTSVAILFGSFSF
jgi:Zn-dependent protease